MDIKKCVRCNDSVHVDQGMPHWCDRYMMCMICEDIITDEAKQNTNSHYIIVRTPEWDMNTWGWRTETDEILEEGGKII